MKKDTTAPREYAVMDHPEHGPKYVVYRIPQGWGWKIRSGRGGEVAVNLQGLYSTHQDALESIHAHEMTASKRYANNPSKHVI